MSFEAIDVLVSKQWVSPVAYVMKNTFDDDVTMILILDTGKHNFGLLARFRFGDASEACRAEYGVETGGGARGRCR